MHQVRVLVVSDRSTARPGRAAGLAMTAPVTVVASVASAQQALGAATEVPADVAVIDVHLPGISGLTLAQVLRHYHDRLAIVLVAEQVDDMLFLAAFRAGAAACLPLTANAQQLVETVCQVGHGETPILEQILARPMVANHLVAELQAGGPGGNAAWPLTRREVEVLDCVVRGMSNREIAAALALTERTVKNHLTHLLSKLAVTNRTQMVVQAMRRGWIMFNRLEPATELDWTA